MTLPHVTPAAVDALDVGVGDPGEPAGSGGCGPAPRMRRGTSHAHLRNWSKLAGLPNVTRIPPCAHPMGPPRVLFNTADRGDTSCAHEWRTKSLAAPWPGT